MSIDPGVTQAYMAQRTEPIKNIRHDLYPAISPHEALKSSAKGLRVLVTGAGRGVGRCTALFFAHAGAAKITITSRSVEELEETKALIAALRLGTEVVVVTGAVTVEEDVVKVFDASGDVDVLVHNAGVAGIYCGVHESTDSWWTTFEANVKGTHLFNRELLRRVHDGTKLSRPITIVNVSSRSSLSTFPGASGYSCSKIAVNKLVEYIHSEHTENLRIFAVHPGAIPTSLSFGVLKENARQGLVDTAELAAGAILWCAVSPDADFLRGRYFSANWDVDETKANEKTILEKKLLVTTVIGGAAAW